MATFNMHDAKTRLSDLVARAEAGEEIVIARRNLPAVILVPVPATDMSHAKRAAPPDFDPLFDHAPDDFISKRDIAAYYRRFPAEWREMLAMVGFGEEGQAEYDADRTAAAATMQSGTETVSDMAKPANATTAASGSDKQVRGFGILAHLPAVPDEAFFEPLPPEDLRDWEGEPMPDPDKPRP